MREIIWEDLSFFMNSLKSLPVSRTLTLDEGFCVSVGTYYENWIYYPENITSREMVSSAVKFFAEREESFMWPVYAEGQELLEASGLIYAGDLTAMCLNPSDIESSCRLDVTFSQVNAALSDEWAMTAWHGFGGDIADVTKSYYSFVRALSEQRESLSLYLAKTEGDDAGVFAVTHEPELMGVYYFATVPEFRRQGIARAMMTEICRLSEGKRLVLQSTPNGFNFYKSFGFSELFKIPVYSIDGDIF